MKRIHIACVCLITVFLVFSSCDGSGDETVKFLGKKELSWYVENYDSIEIKSEPVSWSGSYFSASDNLCYLDDTTCELHFFDWTSGDFVQKRFKKGHSKEELFDICGASALIGDSNKIVMYGCNNFLYLYDLKQDKLVNYGSVNFGYEQKGQVDDYDNPSNYKICCPAFVKNDSNSILLFLSSNASNLDGWYDNSHIFGVYDYKESKFVNLYGNLPKYYKDHPVVLFERFVGCKVKDDIYTTHMLDSLIYVHKNQNEVECVFGFEPSGSNRSYTCKENDMFDTKKAMEDEMKLTENKSLLYSESINCLLRTCIHGKSESSKTTVQLYDLKTFNLVLEKTFSGSINFLYAKGNTFYGVNLMPSSNKNYIYKLKVGKSKF